MQKIRQAQQIQRPKQTEQTAPAPSKTEDKFDAVLQKALQGADNQIKISAHALQRIEQRGIDISAQDMQKLGEAVAKAQTKGSRESLVLMNSKAFIVSVPNKTVITAVDQAQMKENVFTNIDSTVII
ncbi:MAG: flagellar protein [Candidatus Marinimicrobia bacterium]|nr:flagellar protein [Candidatus Neomarinimicrobiota bacterium]